ncbi:MAG: hypothetical protein ACRYG8_44755 [Janthinobacterium lividum]
MAVMQPLRALRAVKPAEAGGTPPLSAERVALAEAIAAHVDLQARRAATSVAIGTASEAIWNARSRVDAAPELMERAKANYAQHLADAARGVPGMPPQTLREARNAATDAQDDLDVAKATRDALQAEMERLDGLAYRFKENVEKAALAVVGTEAASLAQTMAAELMRLQQEMHAAGQALLWLTGTAKVLPVIEQHGGNYGRVADDATRQAIRRLHNPPAGWDTSLPRMWSDAAESWRAAFAALQVDATAPLPLVPTP